VRDVRHPDVLQLTVREVGARLIDNARRDDFRSVGVRHALDDEHGAREGLVAVLADVAVPCCGGCGVPVRLQQGDGEVLGAVELAARGAAAFDVVQQGPARDAGGREPVGEVEVREDGVEALGDAGDSGVVLGGLR